MVGIDARNKHLLNKKYICSTCSLILKDPIQFLTCGHRQCQSCFNDNNRTMIKCPQCETETILNKVMSDRSFQNDMDTLSIECSFCQWNDILKNYQSHLDQFHSKPKCEHCEQQFDSVNRLNEHKVSECQKVTIDCILKNFGCDELIFRNKMEEHYLTEQHQVAIFNVLRQVQSLDKTLSIVSGAIEILTNDRQRLSNEALQMLIKDFFRVKLSVEEMYGFSEAMKNNYDILCQELTSLKEKINDMKYVSYDGTFIWKITNVREKMIDAESERQTSIYSPPFYSSPSGYKMRACMYLNGDGNARGTHMSLYFALMRGLNDPILKFPFTYKVIFCLYDQSSAKRHLIDSFRPDIRSNSSQRPRSNMTIASGIPKFVPLRIIQHAESPYIKDNTMFIKVMVDFGDMPENLLPYVVSLNPGLPTHIQQAMIKQEAERRVSKTT